MNTTPRLLNRALLAVVGILALTAGAAGLGLLTLPAVAAWWSASAPRAGRAVDDLRMRTTLAGQADTWLWLALAAVLLLLIALLVLWIAAQGRGRTGIFASMEDPVAGRRRHARPRDTGDPAAAGTVTITAAAAEQALRSALLERPDLAGASVSTWVVRGVPGLRVRVLPRRGVPAYAVAADVSRLVEALDRVTGHRPPVLISIGSGARVRFSRSDRVA
ncbi:hypothetical protein [Arthrobacter sp. TMS1-12-1]